MKKTKKTKKRTKKKLYLYIVRFLPKTTQCASQDKYKIEKNKIQLFTNKTVQTLAKKTIDTK